MQNRNHANIKILKTPTISIQTIAIMIFIQCKIAILWMFASLQCNAYTYKIDQIYSTKFCLHGNGTSVVGSVSCFVIFRMNDATVMISIPEFTSNSPL